MSHSGQSSSEAEDPKKAKKRLSVWGVKRDRQERSKTTSPRTSFSEDPNMTRVGGGFSSVLLPDGSQSNANINGSHSPAASSNGTASHASGTSAETSEDSASATPPPLAPSPSSPAQPRKASSSKGLGGRLSDMIKSRRSISSASPEGGATPTAMRKHGLGMGGIRRSSESLSEDLSATIGTPPSTGAPPAVFFVGGGGQASGSGSVPMASGSAIVLGASPGVGGSGSVTPPVGTSPKISTKSGKKSFFPGILRSRRNQELDAFSRMGTSGRLVIFNSHFEGMPVVCGNFALDNVNFEGVDASAMIRLEGIPGGMVRAVYSSENMLGVVSQTGELYVCASSRLHFSASGLSSDHSAGGSGSSNHLQTSSSAPLSPQMIPATAAALANAVMNAAQPPQQSFRLIRVRGMGALRRVALGDFHSAAISEDGRVYTWGMNVNDVRWLHQDPANGKSVSSVISGQLGHGFLLERCCVPKAVEGVEGTPLEVAVGSTHTVVLTDKGVFTCGNPMTLGRPDTFVFDCLMSVPGLSDVQISSIACGSDHTLAVASASGAVYSWGLNDHGQLGLPRQTKYSAEPSLVAGSKNVYSVSAGPLHSVCVSATGMVIVWGCNVHGELGIGSDEDRVFEPHPVGSPLADSHCVIVASCSRGRTVVVTDAGEVFQAGLVPGSSACRSFTRIPMDEKYVGGVAVGASHAVYLIDQALTNVMAQLTESRTGSAEAFLRKLLRLFQVAIDNDSGHLLGGVQSRVNRLAFEKHSSVPRVIVDQCVLRFVMSLGDHRVVHHVIRVENPNPYRIECDCFWGLSDKSAMYTVRFTPSSFKVDEGESTFVRCEVLLTDEVAPCESVQTLCQLTARRIRKKGGAVPSSSSGGGFASHYFFLDFGIVEKDQERDPDLVQHLVDTMSTYVPRSILRELHAKPEPPFGPSLLKFPGAVLFIDISGFTALNARLSKLGSAGLEQVSTHLNRYFGQLIDAVHAHGGDVLKFAGDALICLFGDPSQKEDIASLTVRAAQCGNLVQRDLPEYDSHQGFRLTLHIAVGAGDIHMLHLGGVDGHYEHVVMGDPMLQMETAVEASSQGEVVMSREAYELVQSRVTVEQRGPSNFLLLAVKDQIVVQDQPPLVATPEMEAGLRAFLPTSVLARIDAMHVSWLAELRRVTVIFVNLASLTYERGKDVQLSAINDVLCSMQHIVFRYEGMVRQFVVDDKGTVLIAAFGVPPFGHEDDPVRATRAAWEIFSKLKESNVSSSIGVTTGKVFCGSVGSSKRQEYAMVGDIVNLSARLMMVAKKMQAGVIVDETTRELTNDDVIYEALEAVMVKGRTDPVPIAKAVGVREHVAEHQKNVQQQSVMDEDDAANATTRTQHSIDEFPMVGRKAEMGLLQLQVAKLQAMKKTAAEVRGSTKTFLLSGAAGMGKTRVINELARLCRKQNVEYYIGQCDAVEKTKPFFVFQTILDQLMNLELWKKRNEKMLRKELHEAMAEHWQSNNNRVAEALGIEGQSNWAEYLPLLNTVLPLGLQDNEMCSRLDPDKKHLLTISFMAYLIHKRAQEKPVVLIVEDLQWIDAGSMELLAAVAAETSVNTKGILILLSQRTPPQHPHYKQLLQLTGVEELKLMPLSEEECRVIACNTLGVSTAAWIPSLDKMLDKAHGNPLFAMEIAYGLRESGAVTVVDDKLVVNAQSVAGNDIPETIEGMIGSRIDQLPSGPQLLLKVASVVGMEFTAQLLAEIYPIASQRNTVQSSLKELLDGGLLERPSTTSVIYKFKNDTVRDVTYARMLFTQRQQLHEKIALYYERSVKRTDCRMMSLLAHHWSCATLNNNDTKPETILHVTNILLETVALLLQEEGVEEAARFVIDCEKLAQALPSTFSGDSERISVSCKKYMSSIVGLKMKRNSDK